MSHQSDFHQKRKKSINLENLESLSLCIPHAFLIALHRPFPASLKQTGASGIKQGILAQMKRDGLDPSVNNFFLLGITINYPQITWHTTASTPAQIIWQSLHCMYCSSYLGHTAQRDSNNLWGVLGHKDLSLFLVLQITLVKAEACFDLTPFCKHAAWLSSYLSLALTRRLVLLWGGCWSLQV